MSYYIIGLLLSLMSWACSDDVETGREEIPVFTAPDITLKTR